MAADSSEYALDVSNISVRFSRQQGLWNRQSQTLTAVDDVSFSIPPGTTLAIVGESGCGKTTLARAILGLIPTSAGEVRIDGVNLLALRGRGLRAARRGIQMVFQDPFASLNPRMTIEQIVGEPLAVHEARLSHAARLDRVVEILSRVGLSRDALQRYPHEFSGGQRQRVGIARALILRPRVVVLDEPVSALDVSVQAQILNLLMELQSAMGLSYLFIAHNLGVVRRICDHVLVMYLGRVVESGPTREVLDAPQHPYTMALRGAAPDLELPSDAAASLVRLHGETSSPWNIPSGCSLHPRCPFAQQVCRDLRPALLAHAANASGRKGACHLIPLASTEWADETRAMS